jgi:hypothetical protein
LDWRRPGGTRRSPTSGAVSGSAASLAKDEEGDAALGLEKEEDWAWLEWDGKNEARTRWRSFRRSEDFRGATIDPNPDQQNPTRELRVDRKVPDVFRFPSGFLNIAIDQRQTR